MIKERLQKLIDKQVVVMVDWPDHDVPYYTVVGNLRRYQGRWDVQQAFNWFVRFTTEQVMALDDVNEPAVIVLPYGFDSQPVRPKREGQLEATYDLTDEIPKGRV